jgi:hypothetical protein
MRMGDRDTTHVSRALVCRSPLSPARRGVSYMPRYRGWTVHAWLNGEPTYLGRYGTQLEAANAYDDAVREYRGESGATHKLLVVCWLSVGCLLVVR